MGRISTFEKFIKEGIEIEDDDVISFLYSLGNPDLNGMINDFLTTGNKGLKEEYMEDIILEIGEDVEDDEYDWVCKELKKI